VRYLVIVFTLVAPGGAWSNEAETWLRNMHQAVETLNYDGTFVFIHENVMDTMRIIHEYNESGVRERLISLTGEAREVIRDGDVVTCIWPASKVVVVESSDSGHGLSMVIPDDIDELNVHYEFAVSGSSRIAGHSCKYVTILPKDELRYGYRFCIAEESRMLLKSEMLDATGDTIEKLMFTSIEFPASIAEDQFQASISPDGFTWHTVGSMGHHATMKPDPNWHIRKMPPGFVLSINNKRPIAASSQPVQHMIISDGVASISVFISKSTDDIDEGLTPHGVINTYAKTLRDHQITVVGEVPDNTVRMIGESIFYQESESD